jgi:hypothetical protein
MATSCGVIDGLVFFFGKVCLLTRYQNLELTPCQHILLFCGSGMWMKDLKTCLTVDYRSAASQWGYYMFIWGCHFLKQKLSCPFCKECTFKAPLQRMHSHDSLLYYLYLVFFVHYWKSYYICISLCYWRSFIYHHMITAMLLAPVSHLGIEKFVTLQHR